MRPSQDGWQIQTRRGIAMLTTSAIKSTHVAKQISRVGCVFLLFSLAEALPLFAQKTTHTTVKPTFSWPTANEKMVVANQMPLRQIQSFLDEIWKQKSESGGATRFPTVGHFRFAPLGPGEFCLVVTAGDRFPWFLNVACPRPNGFDLTELMDQRMGLLATDLVDLDGDGFAEVISPNLW